MLLACHVYLLILAAEYEIRRGLQRNLSVNYNIVMATDVVQGDLSSPADSGTKEKFIIQLPTGGQHPGTPLPTLFNFKPSID